MSLPQQELKDSYTQEEVQHLIAREWAKHEILALKDSHFAVQRQLVEFMGTNQADSKALRDMLTGFPASVAAQIDNCRKDMRNEMENDFPNKIEAMRMEQRIEEKIGDTDKTLGKQIGELDKKFTSLENKFDKQWIKIATVVSTIVIIGGFLTWFFSTGKSLLGS